VICGGKGKKDEEKDEKKDRKKMKKNRQNVCKFLENAYLCNRK